MNLIFKLITFRQYIKSKISGRFNLGERVRFRRFFLTAGNGKIDVGNDVFFNNNVSLNVLGHLTIGDDVLFGENVKLYDHDHKFGGKPFKISKHEFVVQNITIGSNVWIGSGTIILKGTNIKNNVVIGAGSIISGIIPENTIVIQKRKKVISKLG